MSRTGFAALAALDGLLLLVAGEGVPASELDAPRLRPLAAFACAGAD